MEAPTETTPPVTEEKVKRERTEAQKMTLLKAREKALEVRKNNAELRKKEKQVLHEKEKQLKEAKKDQIESEFNQLVNAPPEEDEEAEEEEEEEVVRKPKKKIKRKIVVVQSSESEEERIEVQLPRTKKETPKAPDQKQVKYERSMQKMFTLDWLRSVGDPVQWPHDRN